MPNAMNRFKPNQLIKVEKENENKDIKRKLKSVHKEKSPTSKAETVWERLSKVKKSASNDNSLDSAPKSRTNLNSRSAHRIPAARAAPQRTTKKPLTPNSQPNRRVGDKKLQQKRSKNLVNEKADDEKIDYFCLPSKVVQDILTARSISNSKTSSIGSKGSSKKSTPRSNMSLNSVSQDDRRDFVYEFDDVQHAGTDTTEDYEVAPLIPVPTKDSLNSSVKIMDNFCNLLEVKQRTMPREDIELVKNVVKTDARHRNLSRDNSKLFKDILKTQLKEILKQETAVKSALTKLDASHEEESSEPPTSDNITTSLTLIDGETGGIAVPGLKKPQVDVIFKNVPTLEKEIIILKALGEKLEATLQRTMSQRVLNVHVLNNIASGTSFHHLRIKHDIQVLALEQRVMVQVTSKGTLSQVGFVREFRIAHKSIVELKEHAHHHFYLPVTRDNSELQRTNFKRLKESPDVLMRHIKPKNSLVAFNVLEQDPIFFNSFIYNNNNIAPSTTHVASLSETQSSPDLSEDACSSVFDGMEGGDNPCLQQKEPLKIEEIHVPLRSAKCDSKQRLKTAAHTTHSKSKRLRSGTFVHLGEPVERMEKEEREATEKEEVRQKQAAAREKELLEEKAVESMINELKLDQVTAPFEAPIRGKQRRRIRAVVTPMPGDKYAQLEPKNGVFKTVLVGAAQISLFLILIMAITYPDVRC